MKRIQPAVLGPKQGPYTAGTVSGKFLFISGQVARNADGTVAGVGNAEAQTVKILDNMKAVLDEAGATFANVARVTIYVIDLKDRPAIQAVRDRYFGDNHPASTMVQVAGLVHPDFLLEIEAIAELP